MTGYIVYDIDSMKDVWKNADKMLVITEDDFMSDRDLEGGFPKVAWV